MRQFLYHNSEILYDQPKYHEMRKLGAKKRYHNRVLGLYSSTARVELEYYGPFQYRFQLAMNSTVIEVPHSTLQRSASADYYLGLRRGWMQTGVDAVRTKPENGGHEWQVIVLNFDCIEFWDRLRWEHAWYQGMSLEKRLGHLQNALGGEFEGLAAAFCSTYAPMGSLFWERQYMNIDEGRGLDSAAKSALAHAIEITKIELGEVAPSGK